MLNAYLIVTNHLFDQNVREGNFLASEIELPFPELQNVMHNLARKGIFEKYEEHPVYERIPTFAEYFPETDERMEPADTNFEYELRGREALESFIEYLKKIEKISKIEPSVAEALELVELEETSSFGNFKVFNGGLSVFYKSEPLDLRRQLLNMLVVFIEHPNQEISWDSLAEAMGLRVDLENPETNNEIQTKVSKYISTVRKELRQKMETKDDMLINRRGETFRFNVREGD